MNYEEKYKQALDRAKKVHNEQKAQPFDVMLKIFPELKESEDERIRKEIISYLKRRVEMSSSIPAAIGYWIAWLEKQGEQKPAWKPSDEQLEALKGVQEGVFRLGILESLYNDLKKLKG